MAPNQDSATDSYLSLPISVATKVDVGRLMRELQQVDNFLREATIRTPGTPIKMPKTSRLLDEMVAINKINLLHEEDRSRLIDFMTSVRAKAPIMHISFSADPSPAFTQKLITRLRAEIHPLVLLQLGLQPNIGAGSVLRTTNMYFDFSLRKRLEQKGDILAGILSGVVK